MIKVVKQSLWHWTVWNTESNKCVDIKGSFERGGYFVGDSTSLIKSFEFAKAIATNEAKK